MKTWKSILLIITFFIFYSYGYRYAIVIGHNDGGKTVEKLKFAENDAERFAQLLIENGGFEESQLFLLLHPQPRDIDNAFKRVSERIRKMPKNGEALFLLYYSGHADETSLLLKGKKFALQQMKERITNTAAGITVGIFDACHSGAVTRFKGGRRSEPFYLKDQRDVKGQVIIASSAATELAQESDMLKGSIFTHHLLNGLRGSADLSGDKKVTLTEAYNYSYNKTVETTALSGGEIQHPSYKFNIHGQGAVALTSFSKQSAGILFDHSLQGKFLVLSENYTDVFADFYKKPGQDEVFISLNPGNYTAINVLEKETRVHRFTIQEDKLYRAPKHRFILNVSELNRIKGQNLFTKKTMEPRTAPLSVYAWGVGMGGVGALNKSLREERPVFSLMFTNAIYIEKNVNLFLNAGWMGPGKNLGSIVGFDFHGNRENWNPFVGVGAGLHWLEKKGYILKEELGPSITLHAGLVKPVTDRLSLQFQIPWTMTFNTSKDNVIGFEVLMVIGGKYRHIKALRYD